MHFEVQCCAIKFLRFFELSGHFPGHRVFQESKAMIINDEGKHISGELPSLHGKKRNKKINYASFCSRSCFDFEFSLFGKDIGIVRRRQKFSLYF